MSFQPPDGNIYAPLLLTQSTQIISYTLTLSDAGTLVELNSASAVALTVPPNSSAAFPVGTAVAVRQYGAGQVTITAGSGVTINSRGAAYKTAGQYSEASLTKRAVNEWFLVGDLTA